MRDYVTVMTILVHFQIKYLSQIQRASAHEKKGYAQCIAPHHTSTAHTGINIWKQTAICFHVQSWERKQEMRFQNLFKRNEIPTSNFKGSIIHYSSGYR